MRNQLKNTEEIEFSVSLFDKCNLGCEFCFSKFLEKDINIERILQMPNQVLPKLKAEIFKNNNPKHLCIRTWGGELFSDDIDDKVFEAYVEYINQFKKFITDHCKQPNLDVEFKWLSNGVFTKIDRVKDLLNVTQTQIAFSYDAVHRFHNDAQKDLWLSNVIALKDKCYGIGITFTKPNIKALMQGDKWFNTVVKMGFPIDGNYYWPNKNWEFFIPTEDDLYEFFIWCLTNCPQLNFLSGFATTAKGRCANKVCVCNNTVQYVNGTCTKDCVRRTSCLDPILFYGEDNDKTLESDENCYDIKIKRFQNIKHCLMCKWYKNCGAGCPGSMIFSHFVHSDKCMYERIYEYLQANPNILENINEESGD